MAQVLHLLFLVVDHPSSLAFFVGSVGNGRRPIVHHKAQPIRPTKPFLYATSGSLQLAEPLILNPQDGSFLLPIFPLRKRVRFPTDALTLNLYEERYLAMSDYIISPETLKWSITTMSQLLAAPCFGALYSSDKPQIITQGGATPIVPILKPGDVGVLCLVLDWMVGMIPTAGSQQENSPNASDDGTDQQDGTNLRRRIRLNGLAVGRFRIDRIVHDGTVKDDKPPFILVEASFLTDDYELEYDVGQMERLQREVQKLGGGRASLRDAISDSPSIPDPASVVDQVCSLVRYGYNNDDDENNQRSELMSFLAASTFAEQSGSPSPKDMTNLLKTSSLQARMNILSFYRRW